MKVKDIRQGLYAILDGGITIKGAFPAVDETPARPFDPPYYEVSFTGITRDENLDGSLRSETGVMAAVVAVTPGSGDAKANDYADEIAALFPGAMKIAITGGQITINGTPQIKGGYPSDGEYRVPVMVPYLAIPT